MLVLFRLSEYDSAARRATFAAVDALARSQSELLGQIESEKVSELHATRLSSDAGQAVQLSPLQVRAALEMDIRSVCDGSLDEVLRALDQLAAHQVEALVGGMFDRLRLVTAATGNEVDAAGRPLSHELVFELLEKMEIGFDENGQANLTLVAGPDMARKLAALPEMTPVQQRRFDEILARKRDEFLAGRRQRRLRGAPGAS